MQREGERRDDSRRFAPPRALLVPKLTAFRNFSPYFLFLQSIAPVSDGLRGFLGEQSSRAGRASGVRSSSSSARAHVRPDRAEHTIEATGSQGAIDATEATAITATGRESIRYATKGTANASSGATATQSTTN